MTEKGKIHPHRPKPSDTAVNRWYRIAVYAILLLSAAVYLPSIDGLALWDDRSLIGAYRTLRQCIDTPFLQHYFRPLVSITFFLEWRSWGRDASYCHLDNILIHTATTGALIGMLRTLFPNRSSGVPPQGLPNTAIALLGGLLFAVQPAQISTVAWIGGRTDSLCTLFLTLFLWTLVLSTKAGGARGWSWTALSAILFGLSLLTKEQALAVLPLVPAVYFRFGAYVDPQAEIPQVAAPTGIGVVPNSSHLPYVPRAYSSLQNHTSDAFVSEGHVAAGRTAKEFIPSQGAGRTAKEFIPSQGGGRTAKDFIPSQGGGRTAKDFIPSQPPPSYSNTTIE